MLVVALVLLIVVGVGYYFIYYNKNDKCVTVEGVDYKVVAISQTNINTVAWVYVNKKDVNVENITKITQCIVDNELVDDQYLGIEFWDDLDATVWKKTNNKLDPEKVQQMYEHYIGLVDAFGWIFTAGKNYPELDMVKLNIEQ